ncbi:transposase (plasmid) [Methylobacterium oryzae CBMB20]
MAYANRSIVERLWVRPEEWRAVATRYEKTAASFSGILCLAAALDHLR